MLAVVSHDYYPRGSRCRLATDRLSQESSRNQLSKSEGHLHGDLDSYGLPVFPSGPELPLFHGLDGLLIEVGVQGLTDLHLADVAAGEDYHRHKHAALDLPLHDFP